VLTPVATAKAKSREEIAAKRKAAFVLLADKYAHLRPEDTVVPPSMTDEELEERFQRKFGAAFLMRSSWFGSRSGTGGSPEVRRKPSPIRPTAFT
jgi:hypothetical protein